MTSTSAFQVFVTSLLFWALPRPPILKSVTGTPVLERPQTAAEELANSISHGAGFVLAAAAAPVLITHAARRGGFGNVAGAAVFAGSLVALYLTSMLYHGLPPGGAKRALRAVEHVAIFLLIAGTYTPFTLGVFRGGCGWALFALIWALAAAGTTLKLLAGPERFPIVSTALYLVMGWLFVAFWPLWPQMPHAPGGLYLIAGGLAYTLGVPFYAASQLRYHHLIWHLFVMTGSAFHFFAVLLCAAPR